MKVITDYTGSSQTRCITIHHADSYKTMCISIRQLGPILWEVDRIGSTDSRGTVRDPWHHMGKVPCPPQRGKLSLAPCIQSDATATPRAQIHHHKAG